MIRARAPPPVDARLGPPGYPRAVSPVDAQPVMIVAGAQILPRASGGHVAILHGKLIADSARPETLGDVLMAGASARADTAELAQLALWWWPERAPGALVEGAFPTNPSGSLAPLPESPDPAFTRTQAGLRLIFYAFSSSAQRLFRAEVAVEDGKVAFTAEELTRS